MRLFPILAMTLAAAVPLSAEDFWNAREPERWSEPEIKRMVSDSPWAREVSVVIKGAAIGFETPGSARSGESTGSGSLVSQIVVRWDSAAPVVEACAQGGMERHLFSCASKLLFLSGLSRKFEGLAKEFYIVTLSDYPNTLSAGEQAAPQHSEAALAALERLSERLRQSTLLKRKGGAPIQPARVATLPAGQTLLVMVFFPRTAALSLDDQEVSFESKNGSIDVKAKFNLGKMVYQGRLAL